MKKGEILNETMQDLIEIQLFNLSITIVFNDLFCCATISNIQSPVQSQSSNRNTNPLAAAAEAAESQIQFNCKP
jgi:hypothetical protein